MRESAPKILLATFGSLGDLHPFIALAHALQREGFRPVVATTPIYADFIRSEGLDFAPIRPDIDDALARIGLDIAGVARAMARDEGFLFQRVIFPFLRENFDDLVAAGQGCAAIVAHSLAFAGRLAAEALGLPLVNVVLSPLLTYSPHDPPMGNGSPFVWTPRSGLALGYNRALLWAFGHAMGLWAAPLRKFRREIGLPKKQGYDLMFSRASAAATIGLYSPLLAPPQPGGPIVAGHSFHDRYSAGGVRKVDALAPELEAFLCEGPAPIVFTLGSFVALDNAAHYRDCVEAAAALGRRAVLLAPDEEVEALRRVEAPGALVTGYAPHSLVFPRACVVAHHGGVGTAGQALRAGKPQLVTPFLGDQHDNAERLRRLGVARAVRGDRVSAAALARELGPLLRDGGYAERAAEAAGRIGGEDGAAAAARRIGEVVGSQGRSR